MPRNRVRIVDNSKAIELLERKSTNKDNKSTNSIDSTVNCKVKELIKYSLEHLKDTELLEENGWSEEDIKLIDTLINNDFDIKINI